MAVASKQKQSGIALITVLMILAIMVTIAATMTGRLTLSLKRTEGLMASQKVYWYGQAAADLGRMVLNQDFADSKTVSLDQRWATTGMVVPLENGNFAGEIKDQRGCFNINAIAEQDQNNTPAVPVTQFQDLLEVIGLESYKAEMIAQSTRDWIDKDDKTGPLQGAEDSFYQGNAVPYLAANNLMVDISELRAMQGVGKKTYERISPYLCAIPATNQKINVNTVSVEQAEILYALFKHQPNVSLKLSDFKALLEDRPTSGWNSINDFFANGLFSGLTFAADFKKQFSVTSDFFQLNGVVEFDQRRLAIKYLFAIDDKKASVIRYQSGGFK